MKVYIVKVPDEFNDAISIVMEKFGVEMTVIEDTIPAKKSVSKKISPTKMFGAWQNVDINPETFRKNVWRSKK